VKGLIVDEPWIGLILSGSKTWEMRKTASHHRGQIALIRKGSGQVVGTAEMVDSLPSIENSNDYAGAEHEHRIPPSRQAQAFLDGWRTPWVLRNARRFANPIPYDHPNGAVIWVNLDDSVSNAIQAQIAHSPHSPWDETQANQKANDLPINNAMQAEIPNAHEDNDETPAGAIGPRIELRAVVKRGKAAGTVLYPHLHRDGCYVVSLSRYEKDYIRVRSVDEVKEYLGRGYSLRMSNQNEANHRSASLIAAGSIDGWR